MSLLIKALDKAQAQKAQAKEASAADKSPKSTTAKPANTKSSHSAETLSLAAVEEKVANNTAGTPSARQKPVDDIPEALKGSAAEIANKPTGAEKLAVKEKVEQPVAAQAQAANVFTAKQADSPNRTAITALLIGLIALGLMGALAYWYQTVINVPDIVIPPRPSIAQEMPAPLPDTVPDQLPELAEEETLLASNLQEATDVDITEKEVLANESASVAVMAKPEKMAASSKTSKQQQPPETTVFQNNVKANPKPIAQAVEATLTANETVIDSNVMGLDLNPNGVIADLGMASESASIQMTRQPAISGVNPVLMRAYEAYKAGNDQQAQQDYMQVLKRFGPNVDAMLGLGAIATRQARLADANGWYRKVLEVEPRNEIARSGLLSLQQGSANQQQTGESNIKSMIATAPNDANLHAALGDIYANKQQWPAAQQAYFDAYRLNNSAENAFNLGVSLDQMGKPNIALPYYREALQKAAQSNVIDVESLKARINSIE